MRTTLNTAPEWVTQALAPFLNSGTEGLAQRRDASLVRWRFESRYFSSMIYFTVDAGSTERHLVAKFPKTLRGRGYARLPPRTEGDVSLAAREYGAFEALASTWIHGEAQFVPPLFYDAPSGLLVFPFIDGADLYAPSLAAGLLHGKYPAPFTASLRTLGRALAQYHRRTETSGEFGFERIIDRIERAGREFGVAIPAWVRTTWTRTGALVPGIRGFEVRNARTASGRIWLFDPGVLRQEPPEADVARFTLSLKMVAWGTPYFLLPLAARDIERPFLEGYAEHRSYDEERLRLCILREISWNWNEGREVAATKHLPAPLRYLTARAYVDPGFRRLWGLV